MIKHRGRAISFLLGACIIISSIAIIAPHSSEVAASIHPSQASTFSDVFAVVVGVSDYPGDNNDLDYCDDDATDVKNMLQTRFNVPNNHITTLIDGEATPAAISNAIEVFASIMDGDDYLLFFFSGHGSHSVTATETISWNIASTHPYFDGDDIYWHYSHAGAEFMRVHFTRVETEADYDGVFVGDYHDTDSAYDLFTGSYSDVWSAWVPTNDIYVELYADPIDTTKWGFEIDKVQTGVISSPYFIHPYEIDLAGMSGPTIDALLDKVPGKVVTILDSCMSGGVATDIAATDRYTIAASAYDEYSIEDSGNSNGAFTHQFLDAWSSATDSDLDGAVSFEEVFPVAYSGTVSRSTSLGSVHHPVQVDNVAGDVIFYPNALLGTVSENGSHGLSFSFTHSGIGVGDLIVAYYDTMAHDYRVAYSSTGMLGQDGNRSVNVPAPGSFNVNGYSLVLRANFFGVSETQSSFRQDAGNFTSTDTDGDGWSDVYEFEHAMNPWSTDSDGDGFTDSQEISMGLSPIVDDANRDRDGDFIPNLWEIQHGLDPTALTLYSDQDVDNFFDWQEFAYGGDPLNPDTDGDGLNDGLEFSLEFDLLDPDMDSDGFQDGIEYYLGNNPQDPTDTPWLHIIAIAVLVALPLLIALASKSKGKANRPAPPGLRPSQKSIVKQASSPILPMRYSSAGYLAGSGYLTPGTTPPAAPAPSGEVTYASYSPGPRYSSSTSPAPAIAPLPQLSAPAAGQITQLPPLAPDIQRQIDSMPPEQQEAVKQMILKKINERVAQSSSTSEPEQAPSPGSRLCIKCGTALTGKWCGSCGWDSGEDL